MPGTTRTTRPTQSPSYTYANAGNYHAMLTVTDKQGGTTTKSFTVSGHPRGLVQHDVP